eukprot:3961953-Pyramimonas_sp.AAC.1
MVCGVVGCAKRCTQLSKGPSLKSGPKRTAFPTPWLDVVLGRRFGPSDRRGDQRRRRRHEACSAGEHGGGGGDVRDVRAVLPAAVRVRAGPRAPLPGERGDVPGGALPGAVPRGAKQINKQTIRENK